MEFREWLINEMRVHRFGEDPNQVLAFRDNVWLYDHDEESDELAQQIWNTVRSAFAGNMDRLPQRIQDRISEENPTMDDVHSFFQDYLQDAMQGWWDEDSKNLNISMTDNPSPISSPLMRKVAQALGARDITYDTEEVYKDPLGRGTGGYEYDMGSYSYGRWDMKGDVPSEMWHGTTTVYFPSIAKYGLMPGEGPSNYARNDVHHDDKIFLSDRQSESRYHAANAVDEQGGWPMVIKVRVPDPSKLVPDYDVDRYATSGPSGKNTYAHMGHEDREWEISSVSPWRSTKHAGKYGYQGRIPSSHIIGIEVRFDKNDWRVIDMEYTKELITNFGKEGWGMYGIDLDEYEEEEWD